MNMIKKVIKRNKSYNWNNKIRKINKIKKNYEEINKIDNR